jgi:hypothetical protein
LAEGTRPRLTSQRTGISNCTEAARSAYLPLFEGKKRSTDLVDDIKNYFRRDGKTIEDAKRVFFDGVRAPSTAAYATIGEVLDFQCAHAVGR